MGEKLTPEHEESLAELDFGRLQVGDQVLLHFEDGRASLLTINEQDENGGLFAKLAFGNKTQMAPEIERWEDSPHRISLKGSCDRLMVDNGEVTVVEPRYGSFVVGRSGWLGFATARGDKELLTSTICQIEHLRIQQ